MALSGIRVVDLTRILAGPFCTLMLADMGAEVIVVEPPEGCATRSWEPYADDEAGTENSLHWWHYNTSKKSVVLDLDSSSGAQSFRSLVATSDVVIEAEPIGRLNALGLDWEQLSDHIQYDFVYDNQFAELKESELMNERLGTLATIEPYIGKYYSNEWVRKKVLRQSDVEIEELDKQIEKEIKDGTIPDPDAIDPITGEPLPPGTEEDVMAMGGGPEDAAAAAITNDQLNKDSKLAEI